MFQQTKQETIKVTFNDQNGYQMLIDKFQTKSHKLIKMYLHFTICSDYEFKIKKLTQVFTEMLENYLEQIKNIIN